MRLGWPVSSRRVVQGGEFGAQRSNGTIHDGIDFAVPVGTVVRSPAPGVVVYAGHDPISGWMLIIDHGSGVRSHLAHLSEFRVDFGQQVTEGQTVALSGDSGDVTGPHLHSGLTHKGVPLNPPYGGSLDVGAGEEFPPPGPGSDPGAPSPGRLFAGAVVKREIGPNQCPPGFRDFSAAETFAREELVGWCVEERDPGDVAGQIAGEALGAAVKTLVPIALNVLVLGAAALMVWRGTMLILVPPTRPSQQV